MELRKILFRNLFIIILLYACTVNYDQKPKSDTLPSNTALASTTLSYTAAPFPTESMSNPPSSITPSPTQKPRLSKTPTFTVGDIAREIPSCQGDGELTSALDDFLFPGTIYYHDRSTNADYSVYSNLTNILQNSRFNLSGYMFIGFSPNGKWAAFLERYNGKPEDNLQELSVKLFGQGGEKIEHKVNVSQFQEKVRYDLYLDGFTLPSYWINDNLIYVSLELVTYPIGSQYIWPLFQVLDPFSGRWRADLLENIPYFESNEITTKNMAGFSPNMKFLLYEYLETDPNTLILHSLSDNKTLYTDKLYPVRNGAVIQWSPDSQVVAYTNYKDPWEKDRRLFLLYPENLARQAITTFTYPAEGMHFPKFSWSPNSRYLAVLGEQANENLPVTSTLYIYSRDEDRFVIQCPLGSIDEVSRALVWSPDNRFIALHVKNHLVIFGMEMDQLVDTSINGYIFGWLAGEAGEWRND